jgi:hypothetical protein
MANVVRVRVSDLRPKYNNLAEWMADANNVYIGRRGIVFIDGKRFPPTDSIWANPYKVGKDGDLNEVLEKFRKYFAKKIKSGNITTEQLKALKGKNLGCWCKSAIGVAGIVCHGDIIAEYVSKLPM